MPSNADCRISVAKPMKVSGPGRAIRGAGSLLTGSAPTVVAASIDEEQFYSGECVESELKLIKGQPVSPHAFRGEANVDRQEVVAAADLLADFSKIEKTNPVLRKGS